MNSTPFVGTMRLAIIAGLLILIAGGNSNAQDVPENLSLNFETLVIDYSKGNRVEILVNTPESQKFLFDPVNTLRRQGVAVPQAAEAPWRAFTIALRRLGNPQPAKPARRNTSGKEIVYFTVTLTDMPVALSIVGDRNDAGTTAGARRVEPKNFLDDPVAALRTRGVDVPAADERAWRQLANALKELRNFHSSIRFKRNAEGQAAPSELNRRINVEDTHAVAPRGWDPKKKIEVAGSSETAQEQASAGDPDRPFILGKAENNSPDKPATYFHLPRPVRLLETGSASGGPTNKLKGNTTDNKVLREQMAAFIMRALGEPNPPPPASQRFADVPPSHPFYSFIDRAVELRIIQGCGRRRYCPDEPVAREQMAAFIIRSLGEFNPPAPAAQRFMDVPPSNPFYAFIELAASRKLLAGCAGGNFCPDRAVTRDETHEALRKTFSPTSKSTVDVPDRSSGKPTARVRGGRGQDSILNSASGSTIREPDSGGPPNKIANVVQPDLRIKQFLFPPTNDKALRVYVVNTGQGPAEACRLVLTARKINGVAAGRKTHVNVPALAAGAADWLHIDARSILPNNISLQSTTFKLNVDATEIVAESNESNNEVWHGLPATAAIGKAIGGYANDGDEADAIEPETTDAQKLSTEPRERSKLSCRNVSARWQVCGSVSRTRFVAGVGIRFNQFGPNGKRIASRSYEHCSELAADQTIPADIRTQAADPCKQVLQLAAKEATVQ